VALGALIKDPKLAFAAGVLSHVAADMIPHRDFHPKIEAALLAGTMALIVKRHGINSPQFWGAVGAIAPDFEHLLLVSGIIEEKDEIFPTHANFGKWHGRVTNERISQLVTFIAGMVIAGRAERTELLIDD
jgi:hypothetical protein